MMTLATGGGKTAIAARWAEGLPGRRALMCCASLEVVRQAHSEYKKWGVVANSAPPGVFEALEQSPAIKVIAAHRATCANRILKRHEGSDAFGALIVDEAHHAADGKGQTSALVRHFRERGKPVLGITATCWRLSKKQGFSETWTDLVAGHGVERPCTPGILSPCRSARDFGGAAGAGRRAKSNGRVH